MKSILLAAACATVAQAHGTVSGFVTDGKWNQGFLLDYYYQLKNGGSLPKISAWYAENLDIGFVEPNNFGTSDINCHKNAKPGSTTASVKAGGSIDFQWTLWPHDIGPVLTYVADCNGDCAAVDKTALRWVKIHEDGWDASRGWAAARMIANNNTWTTPIPTTLAPGNYVFRHETIALHGSSSPNGAQAYPQCFNIAITGSGTDKPTGTLGINLYKADDAGILFNPYTSFSSYKIPGPALYTGGSGSNPGNGGSGSTTTTKTATTTAVTTTRSTTSTTLSTRTTTTAASSPTSGAGSPLYGQCGGRDWAGPKSCSQGTCTAVNDYYSQCV